MKNIFKDILISVKEIKLYENVNLNINIKNDFYNFSNNANENKIFYKKIIVRYPKFIIIIIQVQEKNKLIIYN